MRRSLLAALLLLTLAGMLAPRCAAADASGCSRFASGHAATDPDGTPDCTLGGSGCYECAYDHRSTPGYDICSEDLTGLVFCVFGVATIPDWWPDPSPGVQGPDTPPPGDPNPVGNPGDDAGGADPGSGGSDGGGGPYTYGSYVPPSYLYPVPHQPPYDPGAH
jgi:hypothetical protein